MTPCAGICPELVAATSPGRIALYALLVVLSVAALAVLLTVLRYVVLHLRAVTGNATLRFRDILAFKQAGYDPGHVVDCAVLLGQVGEQVPAEALMRHLQAGGRLVDVARAICLARVSDVPLEFDQACAIDLAGHNVLGSVTSSLEARDIYVPDPEAGTERILVRCGDGAELSLWVRITVRTSIQRLVTGIGEDALVERVGHAVREAAGEVDDHETLLAEPEGFANRVRGRRLDRDAAVDVLSVDVVDVRLATEEDSAD